ncbi:MAG: response regulator [Terriglobia bacterium]
MEGNVSVLIVAHDASERRLVATVLGGLGVEVEALDEGARAAELIKKRKFDGVIVDGELPEQRSLELVREIRKSPSNKKTPVIFITNPDSSIQLSDAFRAGVTFFLTRPLDRNKVIRLLHATHGSLLWERRNYQRVPVRAPVRFKAGSKSGRGTSVNISRRGILFAAREALAAGDTVEMEIGLPAPAATIRAVGEVVQGDSEGCTRVCFTRLAAADLEQLQNFIGI